MAAEELSVKLGSPWTKSSAWARILDDGRVELELYDYSPEAQSSMGNDVAWLYRVSVDHKARLRELLREKSGCAIAGDRDLLNALANGFPDVHAVRDWFKEAGIPYEEQFDSWA